jgi:hypothetical protein
MSFKELCKVMRRGEVVNIDKDSRNTLIVHVAEALVAHPNQADRLVETLSQQDEINEKGAFQDDEIALVVTRMAEAVKYSGNNIEKAVEKLTEYTDVISVLAVSKLRAALGSHNHFRSMLREAMARRMGR